MKFNQHNWNQHLAEIGQTLNTRFAFVSVVDGVATNQMPFVKCRDFFGDVLLAEQTGKTQGIYGFSWNPKKQKLDKEKTRLAIQFVNTESKTAFIKNFKHYRKMLQDASNGISYGVVSDIKGTDLVVVSASKLWMRSVASISWFTYALKVLSYPTLSIETDFFNALSNLKYNNNKAQEVGYYNEAKKSLHIFLAQHKKLTNKLQYVHGYGTTKSIDVVHNSAGFKAVCGYFLSDIGTKLKLLLEK
jgi:hypothetical protein